MKNWLFISLSIKTILGATGPMYLKNGDDWTGTCDIGLAQSPINIETGSFPVIGSFENYEVS
jgi:hypothetical protein